jgi:hypothetical protein
MPRLSGWMVSLVGDGLRMVKRDVVRVKSKSITVIDDCSGASQWVLGGGGSAAQALRLQLNPNVRHQLWLAYATKKYPRDKHVEFHTFQRCAIPCSERQLLNLEGGVTIVGKCRVRSGEHFSVGPNLRWDTQKVNLLSLAFIYHINAPHKAACPETPSSLT